MYKKWSFTCAFTEIWKRVGLGIAQKKWYSRYPNKPFTRRISCRITTSFMYIYKIALLEYIWIMKWFCGSRYGDCFAMHEKPCTVIWQKFLNSVIRISYRNHIRNCEIIIDIGFSNYLNHSTQSFSKLFLTRLSRIRIWNITNFITNYRRTVYQTTLYIINIFPIYTYSLWYSE